MEKPPNQDSQRQNQGEHLSRRPVSFLLLKVVVVVTVTLGMACILALIFKSQKILKPAASVETAVKPPIVQPTAGENIKHIQSKGNEQLSKGETIVLPLKNPLETPTEWKRLQQTQSEKPTHYASRMPTVNANTPITHSQPQSQNNQLLVKSWKLNDAMRSPSQTLHSAQSQVAFTSHSSTSRLQKELGNDRREALAISTPEMKDSVSRKAFPSSTWEREDTRKEDTRMQRLESKETKGHEERGYRDISASSRLPTPPTATKQDIMFQFILEAALLSLLGGTVAIASVHGLTLVVAGTFDLPYQFESSTAALSLGSALLVGVGAGFLPALRASHLNPVTALRST
ncbi:ABC transporter permease [Brasilonema sennae]|uniref:ABC transporter permease n=1 Tax=Brasilonema sennae TaxID=1397703 RepID=UPI001FE9A5DD|nr:ABC transporter permease [Brasilonema sennae]